MFKKGYTPWNKGIKGYINSGSFKKGGIPWIQGKKHRRRSRIKMSRSRKGRFGGKNSPRWKGGIYRKQCGYIAIHTPGHPYASPDEYVYEHRLAMEKKLGRFLKPQERIHHLDGDKKNNNIENLLLCSNGGAHKKIHYKMEMAVFNLIKNGLLRFDEEKQDFVLHFEQAITLNPKYAEARHNYNMLLKIGRKC